MKKNNTKAKEMNKCHKHNIIDSVRSVNPEEYDIEARKARYVQPIHIGFIDAVLFAFDEDVELHGVRFPKVKRFDSEKLPMGVIRLIMRKKVDAIMHTICNALTEPDCEQVNIDRLKEVYIASEGFLLEKICQAYNIHVRFSEKYYKRVHWIDDANLLPGLKIMLKGVFDDNGNISKDYVEKMTVLYHELMHLGQFNDITCKRLSREILQATIELDKKQIDRMCEKYPCLYTNHNVRFMLGQCKHGPKRAYLIALATILGIQSKDYKAA